MHRHLRTAVLCASLAASSQNGASAVSMPNEGLLAAQAPDVSPSPVARVLRRRPHGLLQVPSASRVPGGGVLSGMVVDEAGDPLAGARVRLLRATYRQGQEHARPIGSELTDAQGTFRFTELPGGTYYLAASLPTPGGAPGPLPGMVSSPPIYYPGTSDPVRAQAIRVMVGQETGGLFLYAFRPDARLVSVSGMVVDSRGQPSGDAVVMLNRAGRGALAAVAPIAHRPPFIELQTDGRFAFRDVLPGDYRLDVRARSYFEAIAETGSTIGQPQDDDAAEFASVPVRVPGVDVENLLVRTHRGFRLSGRIVMEGATPADTAQLKGTRVVAYELGGSLLSQGMSMAETTAVAGGTFELQHLAGQRLLRVRDANGWTLKQVRTLSRDAADDGLEIASDVHDVEVVLARSTRVAGTVADGRGNPGAGALVVLFPQDRERWALPFNRYVRETRTREDGTFEIAGLPASRYYAAIVPEIQRDDYDLDGLRSGAVSFSLADGEQRALQLRMR